MSGFTVKGATGEGILAVGKPDPSLVPVGSPAGSITGVPISDVTISHNVVENNDQGTPTSSYMECQASGNVPGDCGEGIHLMSVTDSTVSHNYVTKNSGGILLTDEFGPTRRERDRAQPRDEQRLGLRHHAALPQWPCRQPDHAHAQSLARRGLQQHHPPQRRDEQRPDRLRRRSPPACALPRLGLYDNVIEGNLIEGNGLAGVTLHSHAPGAFIGGTQIRHNLIGLNNLHRRHTALAAAHPHRCNSRPTRKRRESSCGRL